MLVNRYFYASGFAGPLDQTSLKTRWFEAGPRCLFEQCVLASGQSDLLSIAAGPLSRHNDGRTKCPFSGFDLPESDIHIIHHVWWFYYRTSLLNIRLDHHRGYWLIHFIEFGCRSRYPRTPLSLRCQPWIRILWKKNRGLHWKRVAKKGQPAATCTCQECTLPLRISELVKWW